MTEIFHIASAADWNKAKAAGAYTTSTRGVSLAEEGYIHAARREQVQGVFRRYYADATEPLVLLTIERTRLGVEVREEAPDPKRPSVTFPHIYGPVPVDAVTKVMPLRADGRFPSLLEMWLKESGTWMAAALFAMFCSFGAYRLGATRGGQDQGLWWALAGLLIGAVIAVLVVRRRR